MSEITVTTTATIDTETIREVIDDLGFDWYWAKSIRWIENENEPVCLEIVYADGIRLARVRVTYQRLGNAIAALASGKVSVDPYQIRAAQDYLHNPEVADGDAWTTDLVVQWAAFGELVFG